MTMIINQYVQVRKDTSVPFWDTTNADFMAYCTAQEQLGIISQISYSADELTKTRIQTFDDSLLPKLAALSEQYGTAIAAEQARRIAAGITMTSTQLDSTYTSGS